MSQTVKIEIPASVAVFVRPGTSLEERLRGASGDVSLPPRELLILLFCLTKDNEQTVRELAASTLAGLESEVILSALDGHAYHPAVLHLLASSRGAEDLIREALISCKGLADATRNLLDSFIAEQEPENRTESDKLLTDNKESDYPQDLPVEADELLEDEPPAEFDEEGEEYLSKYKMAQVMGIGEKIKMALTGDKEWRKILVKDANKLVSSGVVKNPRMSEPEVLTLLKSGVQNDEIMRLICANKEWVKSYQIRKALIENPKTPLANALRYLGTMNEKDVAGYAKSRNISSVVSTMAKRMLMNKKK